MNTLPPYSINRYREAIQSPAWDMIPRARAELIESKYFFRAQHSPAWDDSILIAEALNRQTLAFLTYNSDEAGIWRISMAYTVPQYRRNGLHSILFEALVKRAYSKDDILAIETVTHIDNIPAQKAFEKQGRDPEAINYSFEIRQFSKPQDVLAKDD